jgi:hypothetical protein
MLPRSCDQQRLAAQRVEFILDRVVRIQHYERSPFERAFERCNFRIIDDAERRPAIFQRAHAGSSGYNRRRMTGGCVHELHRPRIENAAYGCEHACRLRR